MSSEVNVLRARGARLLALAVAAFAGATGVAAEERPRVAVGRAREAFRVPGRDLLPEGIAYDPVEGAFYVGSLHRASIVKVGRDGRAREFVAPRGGGLFSVVGLRVDPARRLLWACSAAGREFRHVDPSVFGQSALLAFDLGTGALRRRAHLDGDSRATHLLNDVVTTSAGDVFATDTDAGRVWVLRPGSETLATFVEGLPYPNGLAVAPGERALYVAHEKGISRVEIATREVRLVGRAAGVETGGIDGLYVHDGALLAVQNGVRPERVVRFRLAGDGAIAAAEVLLQGDPRFSVPTTAAIAGDRLYLLANSQLDRLGEDGSLPPAERLEDPVVLEVELSARPDGR